MDNPEKNSQSVFENLSRLGKNLFDLVESAWESEESKQTRAELKKNLSDLGDSLNEKADEFMQSETGQQLKSDIKDIQERIDSGELETQVKTEINKVLDFLNKELEKKPDNQDR